ncbi:hypothetical protein AB434_1666 [Heyndrickxia coagulans]|uniref:Uncharacterized protein n=1 Tax=Heyndrickxia coagulans TaxID=1398 RepID=A0AAN0WDN9_HEYCO|nr:hypothetical protein SB48_HM08orf05831 [Heyndrickxia coagulans]AKN54071.1 hypothetical protein AB434_1666 [Heyndrickxia coagulans]
MEFVQKILFNMHSFQWNVSRGTLRAEQKNRVSADFVESFGFL